MVYEHFIETERFYISQDVLGFEFDEDFTHEFKGHRVISPLSMSDKAIIIDDRGKKKPTKKPIIDTIGSMLNSQKGGTIYLGVTDDGKVEGLLLTLSRMDHILLEIYDNLNSFYPKVPTFLYQVRFVPIFDMIDGKVQKWNAKEHIENLSSNGKELRSEDHTINTTKYCWCDRECETMLSHGLIPTFFIIEIIISEWDSKNPQIQELFKGFKYKLFSNTKNVTMVRQNGGNESIKNPEDYFFPDTVK